MRRSKAIIGIIAILSLILAILCNPSHLSQLKTTAQDNLTMFQETEAMDQRDRSDLAQNLAQNPRPQLRLFRCLPAPPEISTMTLAARR